MCGSIVKNLDLSQKIIADQLIDWEDGKLTDLTS